MSRVFYLLNCAENTSVERGKIDLRLGREYDAATRGGTPGLLFSPATCTPAAVDNRVYIVAPDRYLSVIDLESGETLHRTKRYKVRESIGVSENGGTVYVCCMEDTVVAYAGAGDVPRVSCR